jgi:hypothetical protein
VKVFILLSFVIISLSVFGQNDSVKAGIYFPAMLEHSVASAGIVLTTTNSAITEELQFRVPAFDMHYILPVSDRFRVNGRGLIMGLQNHFAAGFSYIFGSGNYRFSAGDDIAYWFGFFKADGFNTRANGWLNYPNFSVGRKFKDNVFLTLKSELILNLGYKTFVEDNLSATNPKFYNGQRLTLMLEQPFYNNQWFMLGFGYMHVDLFWQTWIVYENFNRNSFYPQIIAGFIL